MNDRTGTNAGPEPRPEHGPVSVPAAAQALDISERAVQKRIHAGTLRAHPLGRTFMVWLPDDTEVSERSTRLGNSRLLWARVGNPSTNFVVSGVQGHESPHKLGHGGDARIAHLGFV